MELSDFQYTCCWDFNFFHVYNNVSKKYEIVRIGFMYVCFFVYVNITTQNFLMNVHEIWHWEVLTEFINTIKLLLKSDSNNGYFTRRPKFYISLELNMQNIYWHEIRFEQKL
jgi:hypothetical protein